MKKILLLTLCLAIALSMAACGESTPAETERTTAPAVQETTAPTTQPQTEPTTVPTTVPEETAWSDSAMEAMIPQPPFEILYESGIEGIFFLGEHESNGYGGKNEIGYEDLLAYADQLREAGFTEYETSGIDEAQNMYSFCALNPENMCYVTIYFSLGDCHPKSYGWEEDTVSMVLINLYDVANMARPPYALRQAGYPVDD